MKKCTIFAAAPINDLSFVTVPENSYIICADAGYKHAERLNITPDLIVGDFDSASKPQIQNANVISFNKRKDDTDLMLAIKYGIEMGCEDFYIYGALGERLDHTIASITALSYILDNNLKARLIDENCEVSMLPIGEYEIENLGGYLSLFPFGCDSARVSIEGCEYDGVFTLISSFPLGVSNKIINKSCRLNVLAGEGDTRVLVIKTKN